MAIKWGAALTINALDCASATATTLAAKAPPPLLPPPLPPPASPPPAASASGPAKGPPGPPGPPPNKSKLWPRGLVPPLPWPEPCGEKSCWITVANCFASAWRSGRTLIEEAVAIAPSRARMILSMRLTSVLVATRMSELALSLAESVAVVGSNSSRLGTQLADAGIAHRDDLRHYFVPICPPRRDRCRWTTSRSRSSPCHPVRRWSGSGRSGSRRSRSF